MTYVTDETTQILLFTFQRKIKSVNQDLAQPLLMLGSFEAESNFCTKAPSERVNTVYEIGRRSIEEELV